MSYQKQTSEPLYPHVLWNQPINQRAAGSLLVLGGHGQQFSHTQQVFQAARNFGIGKARFVMPDSIRKLTGSLPDGEFLPSTPSGSFAREGADAAIAMANDHDGLLIAAELTSNAETAGFIEALITGANKPIYISEEVLELLLDTPHILEGVQLIVAHPQTLSKWAKHLQVPIYVKKPDLNKELQLLEGLAESFTGTIVSHSPAHTIVGADGVNTTTYEVPADMWTLSAACSVFSLQHANHLEAVTTAVWQAKQTGYT